MVEGQRREGRSASAAEEGELVLGEIFRRDLDQEFRETARIRRHLDHRPVAGGEDAGERPEAQIQRIVPRDDDADDAERLGNDPVARAWERQEVDTATARRIQLLNRFLASWIVSSTVKISANSVSNSLRLPKSALIAATIAAWFSLRSRPSALRSATRSACGAPAPSDRRHAGRRSRTGIRSGWRSRAETRARSSKFPRWVLSRLCSPSRMCPTVHI